jgi:hypothetical protein
METCSVLIFRFDRKGQPSGLHYRQVGGRGKSLGAGNTQNQKKLKNRAESHLSSARFQGSFVGVP